MTGDRRVVIVGVMLFVAACATGRHWTCAEVHLPLKACTR